MGDIRTKLYESFDRKKKKAKNLAPGRTGTNTRKGSVETYTKPGHEGWKIDRGPRQTKTRPKHPGVLSYPTSKRPAGTADPGRRTPTPNDVALKTPVGGGRIKKITVGFGKDKAGKSLGQTTWVDLGKNPSSAMKIKGARMARNQRPTAPQAKAPKAKAPSTKAAYSPKTWKPINVKALVDKHQRLSPHLPGESKITPAYVWKRETNPHIKDQKKSFSAASVGKAIAAGLAVVGATALAKGGIKSPQPPKPPKRTKTKAVEAARVRKPITTPTAPKVKPVSPGAAAQASPELKARSAERRAAEGTKLRYAGYGQKPKTQQKPRSIVELEEPKPVTPKAPETPRVQTAPARPTTAQPAKQSKFQRVREAFKSDAELSEIQASRKAVGAPTIKTPVDKPKVEAKPEGRVARTVKAPARATSTVVRVAKKQAVDLTQRIADAAKPDVGAERKAAEKAVVTPADAPKSEFEDMASDQRTARKRELEARIETGRARQEAAAAKKAAAPIATPGEAEEVKQRDVARARTEADKLRAEIHKAEASPNVKSEQKLETTPDERGGVRQRRGATRMTAAEAKATGKLTAAPKAGSRRTRGSTLPRGAAPAVDVGLQKKLETARELKAQLKAKKEGTTYSGRPSRYDPTKVVTPKPPVPQKKVAPKPPIKPIKHPLGPDPVAVKLAEKHTAAAEARTAVKAPKRLPERPLDALGIAAGRPYDTSPATARVAAKPETEFTPWSDEKMKNATVEERMAYQRKLEATLGRTEVGGETTTETAKRKKAAQKFYRDKGRRIEQQGSFKKGTSTAIDPAIVGAQPKAVAETPPPEAKRRPTEELIREQGIEVRKVPAQKAPEIDAVTEEWEKKAKNAAATRTPLEQAKLNAKELGIQIAEAEVRAGTLGQKIAEAARPGDTLTSDMAEFKGDRIVSSRLSNEGEFKTTILEGEGLKQTVADAQEDLRKGGDRRGAEVTRRNFADRSTKAEASILVEGSKREMVGAKKGTRREKKPSGDRRVTGSTWEPVDIAKNLRPGGLPERRGPSLLKMIQAEDLPELKDYAARGDPIAKETLKQYRAELKGVGKERRAGDTAGREAARLGLDIERAEQGIGQTPSTSTWDPKAQRRVLTPEIPVDTDMMPEVRVYSGDPIKANTLERMDKQIDALEKRLGAPGAGKVHKGQETLEKLKRQRAGIAQDTNLPGTRQFPTIEAEKVEGARVPGEKRIPRKERRAHVRGPEGRRDVPKTPRRASPTGTPVAAEGMQARRTEARRTRPHVGPERGVTTRPAPDLSIAKPMRSAQKPLTGPAIGAHAGEGISEAFKRVGSAVVKSTKKPKALGVGLVGLGAATGLFAAPEVASAYMDAPGDQRKRIKAAGGQALESGIDVGIGIGVFSAGLAGARKLAPKLLKPAVGIAGRMGGAAAVGWTVGTAAGDIYSRVKRVSEKTKREAAYIKEKYGTIEAATRTRKGLKADGTPMTLDDTEEIARRWEREQAKLNKRKGAKE